MIVRAELCHDLLLKKINQRLAFSENADYDSWKRTVKEKFVELTGISTIAENACPLHLQIEFEEDKGFYRLIRFTFESEIGEIVPCYLCVPNTGKKKYPVAIVLQGHSSGFHNSVGQIKYDGDKEYHPRGTFALQAVKHGFIALAIEQRGMGERRPTTLNRFGGERCRWASRVAIELGRTLIGERVWDVSRAIDLLENFPQCDTDKILITGNSGGGTASYYAACYDERIKLSVPSCSFCTYEDSILARSHCDCNYIPSAYRYFEMQDLACLIAPRRLVVVAGREDKIFPIGGVRRGFETVEKIYKSNGAKTNCRLIETPKDHYWCEDIVWNAIDEECEKLGWEKE